MKRAEMSLRTPEVREDSWAVCRLDGHVETLERAEMSLGAADTSVRATAAKRQLRFYLQTARLYALIPSACAWAK